MADDLPPIPKQNAPYVAPGDHIYNTPLSPDEEKAFQSWVSDNNIPFDPKEPVSDYDMRGFYQAYQAKDPRARRALNANDATMHFPDYWKTPYHQSFSNESQWAVPYAPKWNDMDQLVDQAGNVVFDERRKIFPK
jgi:hypothetical protein